MSRKKTLQHGKIYENTGILDRSWPFVSSFFPLAKAATAISYPETKAVRTQHCPDHTTTQPNKREHHTTTLYHDIHSEGQKEEKGLGEGGCKKQSKKETYSQEN